MLPLGIGRESEPPRLVVAPLEVNCPASANREEKGVPRATAEFRIANAGDHSLHVDVDKNCGCLSISNESMDILPGEERPLVIDVRPPRIGRRSVAVTLLTNDPERPIERLLIIAHGSTKPPLVASSSSRLLALRDVFAAGESREITLVTIEATGSERWIKSAASSTEHLCVSAGSVAEEPHGSPGAGSVVKRTYRWTVILKSLPAEAQFSGRITVLAGDPPEHIHSFNVAIEQAQRYRASPSSGLILDADEARSFLVRRILISPTKAGEPCHIADVASDQPWLEVCAVRNEAEPETRIVQVKVSERPQDSFAQARVDVRINGSTSDSLSVPVVYKRNR